MWMQKAVEQAYPPESFAELAAFYRYGMGTETNYFKAEECYRKGIRTRAWKFALTNYINMSEEIQSLTDDSPEKREWMAQHNKPFFLLLQIAKGVL